MMMLGWTMVFVGFVPLAVLAFAAAWEHDERVDDIIQKYKKGLSHA